MTLKHRCLEWMTFTFVPLVIQHAGTHLVMLYRPRPDLLQPELLEVGRLP